MYTAKEKKRFISDAVWIIISEVLGLDYEVENLDKSSKHGGEVRLKNVLNNSKLFPDFDTESIYEREMRLKKGAIDSQLSPEACFDKWRDAIEVYGHGDSDEFIWGIEFEDDWLAMYTPMNSPGTIHLFIYRIRDCFAGYIRGMIGAGYHITYMAFVKVAEIFIKQIVYHEYFHHYTDIQHKLIVYSHERYLEEALAVAWSRIKIDPIVRKILKSPRERLLYDVYEKMIFNYSGQGYSDWIYYKTSNKFCEGVRQYTIHSGSSKLFRDGFNFYKLILKSLDVIYDTSNAVTLHMIYR